MSQRLHARWEERRADRFMIPAKYELRGRSADPALAWAHAAARVQLRLAPRIIAGKSLARHVFAPAYQCIVVRQITQLLPQGKGAIEGLGETNSAIPGGELVAYDILPA